MKADEAKFVQQYLHCIDDKAGTLDRRSLGEGVHGTEVGALIHFDFLHTATRGVLGDNGVGDRAGRYLLVLNLGGYT